MKHPAVVSVLVLGERDDESNQDEITSLGTTGTKCV